MINCKFKVGKQQSADLVTEQNKTIEENAKKAEAQLNK